MDERQIHDFETSGLKLMEWKRMNHYILLDGSGVSVEPGSREEYDLLAKEDRAYDQLVAEEMARLWKEESLWNRFWHWVWTKI